MRAQKPPNNTYQAHLGCYLSPLDEQRNKETRTQKEKGGRSVTRHDGKGAGGPAMWWGVRDRGECWRSSIFKSPGI